MAKTTVQISTETLVKLQALGEAYKRSKAGQLEWMVDQEYEKLQQVKKMVSDVLPKIKARASRGKKAVESQASV